jgi:hypothetical protein
MNRKQFLRRSALFTLAACGLPAFTSAQDAKKKKSYYRSDRLPGGDGNYYQYVLQFDLDELKAKAPAAPVKLSMMVTKYADMTTYNGPSGVYDLERSGVAKEDGAATIVKMKVNPAMISGPNVLGSLMSKNIQLRIVPEQSVSIELAKGKTVLLKRDTPAGEGDEECFLTTACAVAKGLPDDCRELRTLRKLRDTHMGASLRGRQLTKEYYRIAPQIVAKVNGRSNSNEIWELLYTELVQPSVSLVEKGKKKEAVAYYSGYVMWMKEAFLAE